MSVKKIGENIWGTNETSLSGLPVPRSNKPPKSLAVERNFFPNFKAELSKGGRIPGGLRDGGHILAPTNPHQSQIMFLASPAKGFVLQVQQLEGDSQQAFFETIRSQLHYIAHIATKEAWKPPAWLTTRMTVQRESSCSHPSSSCNFKWTVAGSRSHPWTHPAADQRKPFTASQKNRDDTLS